VGYHAQPKGQDFLDGKPIVVHAFEQTDDLAGVIITGMNVVVRARREAYELEFIVTVDNQSRPQRTLSARALPVQLLLPSGLRDVEVEVDNGPDPVTADLRPAAGGRRGVAAAITPGQARVSIRGALDADDPFEFSVAANLGVQAWSLLAWPAELSVRSFDLQKDHTNTYAEFSRWIGPALEPGQEVEVTVSRPVATAAEPVFSEQPEATAADARTAPPARRKVPWLTIVVAVLLLGAYVAWRARR
jgi:hypothetical protein